jgi:hypothetical protein
MREPCHDWRQCGWKREFKSGTEWLHLTLTADNAGTSDRKPLDVRSGHGAGYFLVIAALLPCPFYVAPPQPRTPQSP